MAVATAVVAAKVALDIGQGFLNRGALKVQARFARLAARQRGLAAIGMAEAGIGGQNVELHSSGFAGGGEALANADRTRGAADAEAARFQGWAQAQRLRTAGRNAVIAGFANALGTIGQSLPTDPGGTGGSGYPGVGDVDPGGIHGGIERGRV